MGLIRIILALFVVIYHCGQFDGFKIMQGPEAVQTFYIISGFYMALILNEKYKDQANAYKLFITNRLLKLFPIYWIIVLLILIISLSFAVLSKGENWGFLNIFNQHAGHVGVSGYLYIIVSNIILLGQDVALFLGLNPESGDLFFTNTYAASNPPVYSFMLVPQAWTISIEIMFYLVAPLFIRKKVWVITTLCLIAMALKYYLFSAGFNYDPWSYRFFPAEMLYFLLGVLSYKLYTATKSFAIPKWASLFFFIVVLAVIFLFPFLQNHLNKHFFYIGFALAIPMIFRFTKYNKWDRIIGDYSYPIYIVHVFVKGLVFMLWGGASNVSIPVLIGSIGLAFLFNYFINKKIEIYRQSRVNFA